MVLNTTAFMFLPLVGGFLADAFCGRKLSVLLMFTFRFLGFAMIAAGCSGAVFEYEKSAPANVTSSGGTRSNDRAAMGPETQDLLFWGGYACVALSNLGRGSLFVLLADQFDSRCVGSDRSSRGRSASAHSSCEMPSAGAAVAMVDTSSNQQVAVSFEFVWTAMAMGFSLNLVIFHYVVASVGEDQAGFWVSITYCSTCCLAIVVYSAGGVFIDGYKTFPPNANAIKLSLKDLASVMCRWSEGGERTTASHAIMTAGEAPTLAQRSRGDTRISHLTASDPRSPLDIEWGRALSRHLLRSVFLVYLPVVGSVLALDMTRLPRDVSDGIIGAGMDGVEGTTAFRRERRLSTNGNGSGTAGAREVFEDSTWIDTNLDWVSTAAALAASVVVLVLLVYVVYPLLTRAGKEAQGKKEGEEEEEEEEEGGGGLENANNTINVRKKEAPMSSCRVCACACTCAYRNVALPSHKLAHAIALFSIGYAAMAVAESQRSKSFRENGGSLIWRSLPVLSGLPVEICIQCGEMLLVIGCLQLLVSRMHDNRNMWVVCVITRKKERESRNATGQLTCSQSTSTAPHTCLT